MLAAETEADRWREVAWYGVTVSSGRMVIVGCFDLHIARHIPPSAPLTLTPLSPYRPPPPLASSPCTHGSYRLEGRRDGLRALLQVGCTASLSTPPTNRLTGEATRLPKSWPKPTSRRKEEKWRGAILQSPRALLGEKDSYRIHLSRSRRSNLGREPFFSFSASWSWSPVHSTTHSVLAGAAGCTGRRRRSKQCKLHLYTCGMLEGYYHQQCYVRAHVAVAHQHDPSRRIDSSRAARTRLTRASAESAASAAGRTSVAMPRALGW
eukprot:scaffold17036_cov119-Isochrysis_galbana.AAC.2